MGITAGLDPKPDYDYIVSFQAVPSNIRDTVIENVLGSRPRQLFNRLNALATSLSEEQKSALEKSEHVFKVSKNELRSLDNRLFQSARVNHEESNKPTSITWGLRAIGFKEDLPKQTGKGIKVAVLDSGIDLTHPDFAGRAMKCTSFVPSETDINDHSGHGTHCAGTVAGPAYSNGGVRYGVAPDVEIFIGKVLQHDYPRSGMTSGYDSWILAGIDWAVESGCRIVSLSLASERDRLTPPSDVYERYSTVLLADNPGVLLVAAAGNLSTDTSNPEPVCNPAACDSICAVSALNEDLQVAKFSCGSVGPYGVANIAAPGVNIYSAWINGAKFASLSGTSMATPHVAGVAALYLEADPGLSAMQLRQRLLDRAKPNESVSPVFGVGVVQV